MTVTKPESPRSSPPRRSVPVRPKLAAGSSQSTRLATAILEVLGGALTPKEAGQILGVSLPRYYALETRALNALIESCEPRSKGPMRRPETLIKKHEQEILRLKRELGRYQTLVRLSQRTLGLSPTKLRGKSEDPGTTSRLRRRRKPTARALRMVHKLRTATSTPGAVETTAALLSASGKEKDHGTARTATSGTGSGGSP